MAVEFREQASGCAVALSSIYRMIPWTLPTIDQADISLRRVSFHCSFELRMNDPFERRSFVRLTRGPQSAIVRTTINTVSQH
jgi:hypothetical protein